MDILCWVPVGIRSDYARCDALPALFVLTGPLVDDASIECVAINVELPG